MNYHKWHSGVKLYRLKTLTWLYCWCHWCYTLCAAWRCVTHCWCHWCYTSCIAWCCVTCSKLGTGIARYAERYGISYWHHSHCRRYYYVPGKSTEPLSMIWKATFQSFCFTRWSSSISIFDPKKVSCLTDKGSLFWNVVISYLPHWWLHHSLKLLSHQSHQPPCMFQPCKFQLFMSTHDLGCFKYGLLTHLWDSGPHLGCM